MAIVRRPCARSNFRAGRPAGVAVQAVVVHRTGGSLAALRTRQEDPTSGVSTHYAIGLDGTVEQFVDEVDTAFHAGLVMSPAWVGYRSNVNPNFQTVSVELEGPAAGGWPEAQLDATAELIAAIATRWSIVIGPDTVIPHHAIRASSRCPASDFPADEVRSRALERQGLGAPDSVTTDGMERPPGGPTSGEPPIDRVSLTLPPGQYCAETVPKDLIVLHFTAGQSARSAVNEWKQKPQRIATAYVVDVDGTINETFPPSEWAWHLGIKGGERHERRSIGIEIANVGPLQTSATDPSVLNWWPREFTTSYCRREESDRFVEATYRKMKFFAAFPGAQIDAVGRLVRHLCERYGIPRELPAAARRLEFDSTFAGFKGVATHGNFRTDKWDVGPAFDWDRLGL